MFRRRPRKQRHEAGAGEAGPALGAGAVVAAAARAGSRHKWRILAVSLVVCLVTAVVEIVVSDFVDRANLPLSLLADLSASGVTILGAVFLSGFLTRLIGETAAGGESVSVREVVRTLPWGRLVGADLLVALLVVIGLLALVIPGLVAINLFAVVGPVIEIENKPVIAALRRSAQLVRPHFWTVALLVTLPVAVASEIDTLAPHPSSWQAILAVVAVRGVGEALLEAAIGLVVVQLSYRLIALDRASQPSAGRRRRPGGGGPPGRGAARSPSRRRTGRAGPG
jgi:hypothetical protein